MTTESDLANEASAADPKVGLRAVRALPMASTDLGAAQGFADLAATAFVGGSRSPDNTGATDGTGPAGLTNHPLTTATRQAAVGLQVDEIDLSTDWTGRAPA